MVVGWVVVGCHSFSASSKSLTIALTMPLAVLTASRSPGHCLVPDAEQERVEAVAYEPTQLNH